MKPFPTNCIQYCGPFPIVAVAHVPLRSVGMTSFMPNTNPYHVSLLRALYWPTLTRAVRNPL